VDYLGHVILAHGISMEYEKVNAIRAWTTPQSKKKVLSFLGTLILYSRFIMNVAEVAVPLSRLTGNVNLERSADAEASFQRIMVLVTSAPVLRVLDKRHPIC